MAFLSQLTISAVSIFQTSARSQAWQKRLVICGDAPSMLPATPSPTAGHFRTISGNSTLATWPALSWSGCWSESTICIGRELIRRCRQRAPACCDAPRVRRRQQRAAPTQSLAALRAAAARQPQIRRLPPFVPPFPSSVEEIFAANKSLTWHSRNPNWWHQFKKKKNPCRRSEVPPHGYPQGFY